MGSTEPVTTAVDDRPLRALANSLGTAASLEAESTISIQALHLTPATASVMESQMGGR